MPTPANLISLAAVRAALAQKFPPTAPVVEKRWPTGWAAIDQAEGGLTLGAVTELCSTPVGGGLFLDRMLSKAREQRTFAALVDCGRTFDPDSYAATTPPRLLNVFCTTAEQGVKVTDLLLRDGNLPLVLLDLQALPLRQLGRIPASTWHRFQRLVERSGTAFVVLTPQPLVEAARMRIAVQGRWDLAALQRPRQELFSRLEVRIYRRGRQINPTAEPLTHIA